MASSDAKKPSAANRSRSVAASNKAKNASKKKSAQTRAKAVKTQARKKVLAKVAPGPPEHPHFMGRRVITVDWQGEEAHAVEGRFSFQHKSLNRLDRSDAEAIFKAEVSYLSEPDEFGISIVQLEPENNLTAKVLKAAKLRPDILWCEPILISYGSFQPNDDLFPVQWALKAIKAERAWDLWNSNPNSVVIAVLDTGIPLEGLRRLSHPDLNDPSRFFLGFDWVGNDPDPADDHGHGTHVLGVAAANINNRSGIAGLWPGPVLAIKVIDGINRSSPETFRRGVEEAISFARQRGAHLVINYSGAMGNIEILRRAIDVARAAGALVVAATGNGFGRVAFPAGYSLTFDNVIAVGAVDRSLRRPAFANIGPELTVVAPGVSVMSTMPNYHVKLNDPDQFNRPGLQTKYDFMSGTSQATPMVSALAALVWSKFPHLNASQVRDKIIASATRLPGPPIEFGHGLINTEAALM